MTHPRDMLEGMARPPAATKAFNRIAIRISGHRWLPLWAVLRHRGRSSGKQYAIPVAVIATEATFLIGMPWGRESDWVRNVRAAGGCTIRWRGLEFDCTEPTFVDKAVARAAASGFPRIVLNRLDFPAGFLELRREPGA
jgi:deazaflavin-dependent oxidoreductase (nitroreductase family)